MHIHSIHAEQKLASILTSMLKYPDSWKDWQILSIHTHEVIKNHDVNDVLFLMHSVIEIDMHDCDGRAYFCDNQTVYILYHDMDISVLEDAGQKLVDLLHEEMGLLAAHILLDIKNDRANILNILKSQGITIPAVKKNTRQNNQDISPTIKKRVLLVDDDSVTRWIVKQTLETMCDFMAIPNANQAFTAIPSFKPDVIFLDIDLPDNNGRAVLEWLMHNDPGAYVVMFSSNDTIDNISNTIDNGAKGFIRKPFLKSDLLKYVLSA